MSNSYTKEQIFDELVKILETEFDIPKEKLTKEATLFEDLDLDSIDAVDIAVRMQKFTSKRLTPEEFKQIRTIGDVVEVVHKLLQ